MNPIDEQKLLVNRRHFFGKAATGIGGMALASLMNENLFAETKAKPQAPSAEQLEADARTFAPKAKRIIYLHQSGAPSQMDLFDPKPAMEKLFSEDLKEHLDIGHRITGMTKNQKTFPIAPSRYAFKNHGDCGATVSELLPHIAGISDKITYIKSMHTEAINHDPAITFFQTGAQIPGRPSFGSWMSYGLGSENKDLPNYVVMLSRGTGRPNCQPLYDRLWGSGFLPTEHQGVKFMGTGDPVLYLTNPAGFDATARRRMLDDLAQLNQQKLEEFGDPEINTRIKQYELAYRMQTSVPELTDLSDEPQHVLDMYGPSVMKRGTYAYNCLLARRLSERGVRFVQLYHMGWDQHGNLHSQLTGQCRDADQPSAALINDLEQRGLLDETLVVWAGEFGRTMYCQGKLTREDYGRDHHPRAFTIWMAGGGMKPGYTHGATDEFCWDITKNPVHVHDLNATLLHQMGIDHRKLTFKFQGRHFRLTDVHGEIVHEILS